MEPFSRLLILALLAVTVNAAGAIKDIIPPAQNGIPDLLQNVTVLDPMTESQSIEATVPLVDQKAGANGDAPPNHPVPDTVVTAVDGHVVDSESRFSVPSTNSRSTSGSAKRSVSRYHQVFGGTGTGPNDRDSSVEGTGYLTYTAVPNATYNIDACLDYCSSVKGCVFANLYYEYNNYLLDFVFREKSNLKCAIYGDIHTAQEKTFRGGQQSIDPPAGLTYIQHSSGWALETLTNPPDPEGYELVFGPTNGANNAPGYMGFAFIDKYDVNACASLCNTRDADRTSGICQYFNIWRAVVNGVPTTYTCAFYYIVADESTAVNYGQGNLQVTYSRGYRRKSLIIDGGFEGYKCGDLGPFCFTTSYANWIGTSSLGGFFDATFFHYGPYARTGTGVALLGSAVGWDALAGTVAPAKPLKTIAGRSYVITFFHSSSFANPQAEKNAFVDVLWNNAVVQTIRPGYQPWTFYEFKVTARGNDRLAFHGGMVPSWSFIDDVAVYLL
ncbi:hypothetical protein LshimejAT787_1700510 [Lyophyllum shimeji]|uniref:Fruit-body specific protein a n=1 Tax=Lyophyllum shimeji TaxID=47721 RepID=A0A9P3UQW8_LYOSH|nr:hypothetical protein LshimejAT787_1700510 [Lyophyllum shimeji]